MARVVSPTPEAYRLLQEGSLALAQIEANGIRIDVDYLRKAIAQTEAKIKRNEQRLRSHEIFKTWRRVFGEKANLGSKEQLAHILFQVMRFPVTSWTSGGERGSRGRPSADESHLQTVDLPFVRNYIQTEKLKKVSRTFLQGIHNETVDGYLHPVFNLHVVVTYRSCVAKGTLIETVRDVSKHPKGVPIEDVRAGDFVYCYDDNLNLTVRKVLWAGKTGVREVIRLHWSAQGKKGFLDVTPEHRIRMTSGEYVEARKLVSEDYRTSGANKRTPKRQVLAMGREGDKVFQTNRKITKVEFIKKVVDVYDLEVEEHHNFIANEICVHNSSDSPNFQNLPIRNPKMAKIIRSAFIPRSERHVLVEIDYSGIEVRVATCYHKDPVMIEYINDPAKDMHRDMAAQCYLVPPEQVSKQMRYCGKNMFVFPQFYGDYYVNNARALWEAIDKMQLTLEDGTSLKEHLRRQGIHELGACIPGEKPQPRTFEKHLQEVEKDFWGNRFAVYGAWKEAWWAKYQKRGWIEMLTGFRIEGHYGRNDIINYPVQGAAFHCLLWSLIRINRELKKRKMRSCLVGQIHDSVIADVHVRELDDYLHLAKKIMTEDLMRAWKWLIVPIEIEAEVTPPGQSWYHKAKVEI